MCSLKHAFVSKEINTLVYKVIRGAIPSIPSHYSTALKELFRSILVKHPNKRPNCSTILQNPLVAKYLQAKFKVLTHK
jgi:NIMA (never in mitosis gene a)-related kinase